MAVQTFAEDWEVIVLIMINSMKNFVVLLLLSLLIGCSNDGYRIEGGQVVYDYPWNRGQFKVLDADPNTFVILGDDNVSWAKDHNKVFFRQLTLEFLDSSTFEVLSINFAKDKDQVICGRDVIKETNPNDFKVKLYTGKDSYQYIFGIDKNAAYLCSRDPNGYSRLPSKSIDSFEQLDDGFYKDTEKVFWGHLTLSDVNASSFKVLSEKYATDGVNVYYGYRLIKGADPNTFRVIDYMHAKDKKYKYEMEERVN